MWACCMPQNSAHWPRYRPGLSARIHSSVTRDGMRSRLPWRLGTQKLWMTSLDVPADLNGAADGDMNFIGGNDDAAGIVVEVADVPPPLIARDLDRQAVLARREVRDGLAGSDARDEEAKKNDNGGENTAGYGLRETLLGRAGRDMYPFERLLLDAAMTPRERPEHQADDDDED